VCDRQLTRRHYDPAAMCRPNTFHLPTKEQIMIPVLAELLLAAHLTVGTEVAPYEPTNRPTTVAAATIEPLGGELANLKASDFCCKPAPCSCNGSCK
jgi:hypothetical protein